MSEKNNLQKGTTTNAEIKKAEDLKLEMKKRFAELAKNSLVRVQYSCSGNSCGIDVEDFGIDNMEGND
ncbi:MAG: hypothetical protein PHS59_11190 [Paludibacter sp.]|nr:hypothetical protein [Paludibacter sp.]